MKRSLFVLLLLLFCSLAFSQELTFGRELNWDERSQTWQNAMSSLDNIEKLNSDLMTSLSEYKQKYEALTLSYNTMSESYKTLLSAKEAQLESYANTLKSYKLKSIIFGSASIALLVTNIILLISSH